MSPPCTCRRVGLWRPLQCVVVQQLFYEVHMRHEHPPTAVAGKAQSIQRISASHRNATQSCAPLRAHQLYSIDCSTKKLVESADPSLYSACNRSRYVSHLLPIT